MRKGTAGSLEGPRVGRRLAGLDGLNFVLADARGGLGPVRGIDPFDEPRRTLLVTLTPRFPVVVAAPLMIGAVAVVFAPAIAALALGLLGPVGYLVCRRASFWLRSILGLVVRACALAITRCLLDRGAVLVIAGQKALFPAALITVSALALPQIGPPEGVVSP